MKENSHRDIHCIALDAVDLTIIYEAENVVRQDEAIEHDGKRVNQKEREREREMQEKNLGDE